MNVFIVLFALICRGETFFFSKQKCSHNSVISDGLVLSKTPDSKSFMIK